LNRDIASIPSSHLPLYRLLSIAIACLTLLFGCSEPGATATSSDPQDYPEPPPPITSATQILSGGWLVAGDGSKPQFDSVIVVTGGTIVAMGKRGQVPVPADSVGLDASGKWILPGPLTELRQQFAARDHAAPLSFSSNSLTALTTGRAANLVLLNRNPLTDPEALTDLHAQMHAGDYRVTPQSSP